MPAARSAVAPAPTAVAAVAAADGSGMLQIPAPEADTVEVRFASLLARDKFDPQKWRSEPLKPSFERAGWCEIDLNDLHLDDGVYEYEFILDRHVASPIPDPFAEELTRFGGYRGVFRIVDGQRRRLPFSWDDEFTPGAELAQNHQLVIYELPLRWVENAPEHTRQVGLGTFEGAVFRHLDRIADLGINAIELLPVQDSPDTLNWGYGTRFFFAPDLDMGGPIGMRYFVKQCHRRGIRVIFDVVMNHDGGCPLRRLSFDDYFLEHPGQEPGRGDDYGQRLFRYRPRSEHDPVPAREFQYQMAEFLIREYHADGFRVDEFRGIDNWEFIQEFRDRAWSAHQSLFPGRPFIVIAEDSWRRAAITHPHHQNPRGRKVTDSMWNFAFRDETRRIMRGEIHTQWGQPARRERIRAAISGQQTWDDLAKQFKTGFYDMAQAVNYLTSHDVEGENEKRIMNHLLGPLLRDAGFGHTAPHVQWVANHLREDSHPRATEGQRWLHDLALERVRSAFGLLLTSVGIPMILAGDEFADVHDLDHTDWRLKMSDPVDWERRDRWPQNIQLWENVREMIELRKTHPALLNNEIDFFYFHPTIDADQGERVFAYCRTRGEPLGRRGQVIVVANAGPHDFPEFWLNWPWADHQQTREIAPPTFRARLSSPNEHGWASLSLAPHQVRVFAT